MTRRRGLCVIVGNSFDKVLGRRFSQGGLQVAAKQLGFLDHAAQQLADPLTAAEQILQLILVEVSAICGRLEPVWVSYCSPSASVNLLTKLRS